MTLRVLVEFVPDAGGDEPQRELARAEIRGARIDGMVGDYSLAVSEGPNPLANTPAWVAAGDIVNHDRAQTVWTLVEKISMFALIAASHHGSVPDLIKIVGSLPESIIERLAQFDGDGGRAADEVDEITKDDLRGCPTCDAVTWPQWKFCAFCGEKTPE